MPRILLAILLLLPAACAMPVVHESDRAAIAGRIWVVTGASSGIGRGIAERAGSLGARVVLAARRAEALEGVAATIRAAGGEALVVPTDVSRPEAVEALAEAAERRFGRVDVWVNNAGVAPIGRFEEIPVADHARTVAVNLNGVIFGSHAALRRFRAQGHGTLVNMASVEGRVPLAYHASYAATKHAIIGLDGALRQELRLGGLDRLRVVTILPWAVDTPFWANAASYAGREPRGPWMDGARDVAEAVVWASVNAPSGEFPVGPKASAAVLGSRLAPGLTTRIAGSVIHRLQMEEAPPAPDSPGNLHAPSPAPPTVEGGFRGR
ncbi:SDR family NAD(P)-dependent oxidoreductase [Belnapia rosea]|uniref:SDR family NAD(P)-dependent oxidoreductase n=1 Tax=Belnapia rosea TaxID=938405 RepID=UPI000885F6CB|nr:SDR family NAD(P)-dependent oxidoreductase [Belnapia rosea]SDB73729.1 Short-chain dehydrogenase [Belnapia rosea]